MLSFIRTNESAVMRGISYGGLILLTIFLAAGGRKSSNDPKAQSPGPAISGSREGSTDPLRSGSPSRRGEQAEQQAALVEFQEHVKAYMNLRRTLTELVPALPDRASAETIEAHQHALQELVRASRAGARPGDVFSPDVENCFRRIILDAFSGPDEGILRETIEESLVRGVPLQANHPYPDGEAVTTVPPRLLQELPPLPSPLAYRFLGRSLILLDEDARVILDYIRDCVPRRGDG